MRKKDLESLRASLEEERDRVRKSLTRHELTVRKSEGAEDSASSNHLADAGSDEYSYEQLLSLVKKESRFLYRVEEALTKIQEGGYGACELCEKVIGLPRLKALPFTRMCIECAEKEDAKR